jgi:hypothetical protein
MVPRLGARRVNVHDGLLDGRIIKAAGENCDNVRPGLDRAEKEGTARWTEATRDPFSAIAGKLMVLNYARDLERSFGTPIQAT